MSTDCRRLFSPGRLLCTKPAYWDDRVAASDTSGKLEHPILGRITPWPPASPHRPQRTTLRVSAFYVVLRIANISAILFYGHIALFPACPAIWMNFQEWGSWYRCSGNLMY